MASLRKKLKKVARKAAKVGSVLIPAVAGFVAPGIGTLGGTIVGGALSQVGPTKNRKKALLRSVGAGLAGTAGGVAAGLLGGTGAFGGGLQGISGIFGGGGAPAAPPVAGGSVQGYDVFGKPVFAGQPVPAGGIRSPLGDALGVVGGILRGPGQAQDAGTPSGEGSPDGALRGAGGMLGGMVGGEKSGGESAGGDGGGGLLILAAIALLALRKKK